MLHKYLNNYNIYITITMMYDGLDNVRVSAFSQCNIKLSRALLPPAASPGKKKKTFYQIQTLCKDGRRKFRSM